MTAPQPAGRPWELFTRRDFDQKAADAQMSLFAAPDECGSFTTLFDDPDDE